MVAIEFLDVMADESAYVVQPLAQRRDVYANDVNAVTVQVG